MIAEVRLEDERIRRISQRGVVPVVEEGGCEKTGLTISDTEIITFLRAGCTGLSMSQFYQSLGCGEKVGRLYDVRTYSRKALCRQLSSNPVTST